MGDETNLGGAGAGSGGNDPVGVAGVGGAGGPATAAIPPEGKTDDELAAEAAALQAEQDAAAAAAQADKDAADAAAKQAEDDRLAAEQKTSSETPEEIAVRRAAEANDGGEVVDGRPRTAEEAAAPVEHPEPMPVGIGVVQDNVSVPGEQHTHTRTADGSTVSVHEDPKPAVVDVASHDVVVEDVEPVA